MRRGCGVPWPYAVKGEGNEKKTVFKTQQGGDGGI